MTDFSFHYFLYDQEPVDLLLLYRYQMLLLRYGILLRADFTSFILYLFGSLSTCSSFTGIKCSSSGTEYFSARILHPLFSTCSGTCRPAPPLPVSNAPPPVRNTSPSGFYILIVLFMIRSLSACSSFTNGSSSGTEYFSVVYF
jgi:hypothetical protein